MLLYCNIYYILDWERNRIEGIINSQRLFPWNVCLLNKLQSKLPAAIRHRSGSSCVTKDKLGCLWIRMEKGSGGKTATDDTNVQSLMVCVL